MECHYWRKCTRASICIFIFLQTLSGYLILHFGKGYQLQYYPEVNNVSTGTELHGTIFSNNDTFTLQDDTNVYFQQVTVDLTCYIIGTNLAATQKAITDSNDSENDSIPCICKSGYYGEDCGIPDAIWHSRYKKTEFRRLLKRRVKPRRVINGLPLLKEMDLLEARLKGLGDAVDLFMLAESNYTAHGDHKELYIRDQLHKGFLREFHHKILHVYVDFFPEKAKKDSWLADEYLRNYMGKMGIPRVSGVRDDDLFIINDADEVPSRPVVMFLKLYDGYTEPVALVLRWSIFGFFWKSKNSANMVSSLLNWNKEATTTVYAVTSMGVLRDVMGNDPFRTRKIKSFNTMSIRSAYDRIYPNLFDPWEAGSVKHYAGWHCSWCFSPKGIVLKLDSAQAGDKPRWGDYPEKHDKVYLEHLIRDGRWFDGSSNMFLANPKEKNYAPPFMISNYKKFHSILFHPKQKKQFPYSEFIKKLETRAGDSPTTAKTRSKN